MLMYRKAIAAPQDGASGPGSAMGHRLLAVVIEAATASGATIGRWIRRARARRILAALDHHQLRDIGLLGAAGENWNERLDRLIGPRSDTRTIQQRALADLDESHLCDLSEAGVRAWRQAQREKRGA